MKTEENADAHSKVASGQSMTVNITQHIYRKAIENTTEVGRGRS